MQCRISYLSILQTFAPKLIFFKVVDDFNYPDVEWDRPWLTKHFELGNIFQAAVDELCLTQLISEPTHGNSIFDLALISRPESVRDCFVLSTISKEQI